MNTGRVLAYLPYFEDEEQEKFKVSAEAILSPYVYAEQVMAFIRVLHEEEFVYDFDWQGWKEEAVKYLTELDLIAEADLETIRKLFTTIVRAEKLGDGFIAEMIKKGVILDLLKRLEALSSLS